MRKWLTLAIFALCLFPMSACRNDDDSSVKKPHSSTPATSSAGVIELPEDKFD